MFASQEWHRFILRETWLYNLLLPDHSPAASKTFQGAGLLSSASKSVKRFVYALKRCRKSDKGSMAGERILIVEDERAVARGLEYGLTSEGFTVLWADTGQQGLVIEDEIAFRKNRLASLAEAKAVLEARSQERYEAELAEYEGKVRAREEKARQ